MGFITWIVVGLIAGWLAGQVMKGGGYGLLVDIILGICGGVLGLGLRPFRNLARRRHSRCHHRGICWRRNFGWDYSFAEKSLKSTPL